MSVTYPENYLTIRYQRLDTTELALEYANLVQLSNATNVKTDANLESQKKLLEIEQYLTQAHALYFKRQYRSAIDAYKRVQSLIYKLLYPGNLKYISELVFSTRAELFKPLMAASLEYIEALTPTLLAASFAPAFVEIPAEDQELIRYQALGVNLAENLPRTSVYDSQLAATYADQGQWERAEYFYQRARKPLGNAQTADEIAAKAAIDLSLGGVYVQMGQTSDAKAMLEQAARGFSAVQDSVGQAQVNLNLAAAFVKEGAGEQASRQLDQAKELLKKARGVASNVSSTTPPINPRPTDPVILRPRPDLDRIPPISRDRVNLAERGDGVAATARLATISARNSIRSARIGSTNSDTLSDLSEARGLGVTYRQIGKGSGWSEQKIETNVETQQRSYVKELGVLVGDRVFKAQWQSGGALPVDQVIDGVYLSRVSQSKLSDVIWKHDLPSDLAVQLPHLYFYVIPVALGDCYHALGEYDTAESYYLQGSDYAYINTAIEVPALWQKLAENTLAWGDWFYREDDLQAALERYRRVLEPPGTASVVWAESPLYKHPKLKLIGDRVASMLTNYATNGAGDLNPVLAAIVLEIRARVLQLNAGLDFLGASANAVPIWSFEYLQNVARYFAQQAIQAEREFVNFQDRAENESLTRQQLQQAVTLGQAEQELAKQQREAAQAEAQVYVTGKDLATLRQQNAQQNRQDYANLSPERIWIDAANAFYGIGSQRKFSDGRYVQDEVARLTERRGQLTLDYELASMDRQAAELQKGAQMAQDQLKAAQARTEAAQQMEEVARLRSVAAAQNLAAFNNQFFTPEIWYQMGAFMRRISQSYLYMAVRIARLMQRAYNFENDSNRRFIKVDYSTNTIKGLLAGDSLLLDIESFTYDLITSNQRKQVPIKQTISLAERYPFLFETQFRRTGKIDFETRSEDFDRDYPGTYNRRLESIEVEVEGILPESGVRGILTNGGISRDRTTNPTEVKFRVQPKETLVLSQYRINQDSVVFPADPRRLKVFEGAGVVGSWTVEIPKASNDVDFGSITDIRLTFYYHARYDEALATAVNAQLASFAGVNLRSRTLPLRWAFPDAFFHFQDTGRLDFVLDEANFPFNETLPQIRRLTLLVVPEAGVDPSSWQVRLGVPANPTTIASQPKPTGEITAAQGQTWHPLVTGSAIGAYTLEMRSEENPSLVETGVLNLNKIQNFVLILEYEYTPRV